MKIILVADIGGTNARFSCYKESPFEELWSQELLTEDIDSFPEFIEKFLVPYKKEECVGIFAAAGEKKKEFISLTNQNLIISKQDLLDNTSLKECHILNDFEAIPYTLDNFPSSLNLNENSMISGAGTGLGVSYLLWKKDYEYEIKMSEDGHNIFKEFSPYDELFSFVKKKLNKKTVEYEDLLSGNGLEHIYNFYTNDNKKATQISEKEEHIFQTFFALYSKALLELSKQHSISSFYITGGVIEHHIDLAKKYFNEKLEQTVIVFSNKKLREYLVMYYLKHKKFKKTLILKKDFKS